MPVYVTGHVNPDTDSIAAAIGYAWLLRERDGIDAIAARAGALNRQTTWVLKKLGLQPPYLLNDASPRFESVSRRLDTVTPDTPLREAWSIASRTWGVAPVVTEDGRPYGLITGGSLFSYLTKVFGPKPEKQETTIGEILETPCEVACRTGVPAFKANTRIRDSLNRILREEGDNFFVVDEDGYYLGVCRQRELLNPPRLQLVLVDHNEPRQSVGSLEEAELLEILDHHRLGNPSTRTPIKFTVDIVGSTSTLIAEKIADAGLSAPPKIAGVLLAGLLSDTLIFSSPTTTERDHRAAERLARWAFVRSGPLAGETIESYGQQVLSAGAGLSTREPDEIVSSDMKVYEAGGYRFSISQAEVTDLLQMDEHIANLREALHQLQEQNALDFALLMVTDVVRGSSRLLIVNEPSELDEMPYLKLPDGTRMAEGVVSRKKQLLPVVLGLLEN